MNRPIFIIIVCFICALSIVAQSDQKDVLNADEYIVSFDRNLSMDDVSAFLNSSQNNDWNFTLVREIVPNSGYFLIKSNTFHNPQFVKNWFLSFEQIIAITPNLKLEYRNTLPNDPFYQNFQWSLEMIGVPEVWDESTGGINSAGDTIVLAVIDNGFDVNHDDLKANIWRNSAEIPGDFIDNDANGYIDDYIGLNVQAQNDDHANSSHGTSVAGIIGAQGDNSLGITGINWDIKLMLVSNVQYIDEIIEAYYYVLRQRQKYNRTNGSQGAYIVATNFSAGIDRQFGSDFPLWCNVYDSLGIEGVLSVSSTTNENYDVDEEGDLPSTCGSPYLIVTTNTNVFDKKAPSAGYGKLHVDLGAPGSGTFSLNINNEYSGFDGTSGSAPHVSASIALIHSVPCEAFTQSIKANPAETSLELRKAILDYVVPLEDLAEITSSGGRLSISNSLEGLKDFCLSETGTLAFYPKTNPTRDTLSINYQSPNFEDYALKLFSAGGQMVYKDVINVPRFSEKNITIDTRNLAAGMYFVVLHRGSEQIVQKIIVH